MGRLAGALAVLAVASTSSVQAAVVPADGQPLSQAWQRSVSVAEAAFPQAVAHCPVVTVLFTEDGRRSPIDNWAMWADRDMCEVGARPEYRNEARSIICPLVVHEWGHLAGLGHSEDPTSVMHALLPGRPAQCGPSEGQIETARHRIWTLAPHRRLLAKIMRNASRIGHHRRARSLAGRIQGLDRRLAWLRALTAAETGSVPL